MNRYLLIALFGLLTSSPLIAAGDTDPSEYTLVGLARCDGISYACLADKQTGDTFTLRTGKSERGFTLASVTGGHDEGTPSATIQKNGHATTLYLHTFS